MEENRFTSPTSSAQVKARISPTPGIVCNRITRWLSSASSLRPFSNRRCIAAKNSTCPRLSLSSSTTDGGTSRKFPNNSRGFAVQPLLVVRRPRLHQQTGDAVLDPRRLSHHQIPVAQHPPQITDRHGRHVALRQ